jgi:hypothetical protein
VTTREGDFLAEDGKPRKKKNTHPDKVARSRQRAAERLKRQKKVGSKQRQKTQAERRRRRKKHHLDQLGARLESIGMHRPSRLVLERLADGKNSKIGELVDEVAMEIGADDRIRARLEGRWPSSDDQAIVVWRRGLLLTKAEQPVALVCPSHASISGGVRIRGPFVQSGEHWRSLWSALGVGGPPVDADVEADVGEVSLRPEHHAGLDPILDLSQRVSSAELSKAKRASRRLREDRSLALPIPAVIRSSGLQLRFFPIRREGNAPIVPFEYLEEDKSSSEKGVIFLASPETPISIGLLNAPEEIWGRVAVTVLEAFADLTCFDGVTPERAKGSSETTNMGPTVPRPAENDGPPPSTSSQPPRSAPRNRRGSAWGQSLIMVGDDPLRGASVVLGHIRRLGPDRQASSEAVKRARDLGISLKPGETWVSPHTRGAGESSVLRFEWKRSTSN